jgi:hypothetical protein
MLSTVISYCFVTKPQGKLDLYRRSGLHDFRYVLVIEVKTSLGAPHRAVNSFHATR